MHQAVARLHTALGRPHLLRPLTRFEHVGLEAGTRQIPPHHCVAYPPGVIGEHIDVVSRIVVTIGVPVGCSRVLPFFDQNSDRQYNAVVTTDPKLIRIPTHAVRCSRQASCADDLPSRTNQGVPLKHDIDAFQVVRVAPKPDILGEVEQESNRDFLPPRAIVAAHAKRQPTRRTRETRLERGTVATYASLDDAVVDLRARAVVRQRLWQLFEIVQQWLVWREPENRGDSLRQIAKRWRTVRLAPDHGSSRPRSLRSRFRTALRTRVARGQ